MFDYLNAARRIGLPDVQLDRLCNRMRSEFPNDDMMFELHVLRAVMAVESGRVTCDQILAELEGQSPVT